MQEDKIFGEIIEFEASRLGLDVQLHFDGFLFEADFFEEIVDFCGGFREARGDPGDAEVVERAEYCVHERLAYAAAAIVGKNPEFFEGSVGFDFEEVRLRFEDCGGIADDFLIFGFFVDGDTGDVALVCDELLPDAAHFPGVLFWGNADGIEGVVIAFDLLGIERLDVVELVDMQTADDDVFCIHIGSWAYGVSSLAFPRTIEAACWEARRRNLGRGGLFCGK